MTSEQFADQVERVVTRLRHRILGTGKDQYDKGDTQAIENKSSEQVLRETLEEIEDAIVYLSHLHSRLSERAGNVNE